MTSCVPTSSTPRSESMSGRPVVRDSIHAPTKTALRTTPAHATDRIGRSSAMTPHAAWAAAVSANSRTSVVSPAWLPAAVACTMPAAIDATAAIASTERSIRRDSAAVIPPLSRSDVSERERPRCWPRTLLRCRPWEGPRSSRRPAAAGGCRDRRTPGRCSRARIRCRASAGPPRRTSSRLRRDRPARAP